MHKTLSMVTKHKDKSPVSVFIGRFSQLLEILYAAQAA